MMLALEEAAKHNPRLAAMPWAGMVSKPAIQAVTATSYQTLFHAYAGNGHSDGKGLLSALSREIRGQYERDKNQIIALMHEVFDHFRV